MNKKQMEARRLKLLAEALAVALGYFNEADGLEEVLFPMHTHAELCRPEEIVYKEPDMLLLMKACFNRGYEVAQIQI